MKRYDVIIIGAGASGLMCAAEALKRGRSVLVLERADKAGKKILISGGGRCNFTNLYTTPDNYLSQNPHFCKSALSRYTPWDFLALMEKHQLSWEEKQQGQLFCQQKAPAVLAMLLKECQQADLHVQEEVMEIAYQSNDETYQVTTNQGQYQAPSLVVATGGASIPKMGATDFALQVARQFRLKTLGFKPALVPFTFTQDEIDRYFKGLSGVSFTAEVSTDAMSFTDQVLITHRGLSGPAILQISSYWQKGQVVSLNLLPEMDVASYLSEAQQTQGKMQLKTLLSEHLPKQLAQRLIQTLGQASWLECPLGAINSKALSAFGEQLNQWQLTPSGTEGMRTAEVCLGGVDTDAIDSKTLQAKTQPGLYFIGEALDVSGQLGGFNFQWAWASGWAAGQSV